MVIVMSERLPHKRGHLEVVMTHGGLKLRIKKKHSHDEWNPTLQRIDQLRRQGQLDVG